MGIISCTQPQVDIKEVDEIKNDGGDIKYVDDIWDVFEFKKKIGDGATADVALVSHKGTDTFYALKMVKKKKRKHFDRERKILSRFDCPNIVRLNDVWEDSNRYYFSLEYCAGDSLISRAAKRKTYTENVASKTVTMILKAVKYIHDLDIIHRDIKPENLVYLSDKDAALKLLDFGLAIEVPPEEKFTYRSGTPYYMAPEVIRNTSRSAALCKKADVWCLGICLYILLNGSTPFKGNNRDELFTSILYHPLEFRNKDISTDAKDLLIKIIEKDPEKRINVSEALSHPWIMRGGQEEKEMVLSTAQALKQLHTKHSVHRALEEVAIQSLDEFDDKAMRQLFDRYDKNGDGNITREELASALEDRHIYRETAIKIAREVLARTDTNQDCMIQFEEFKIAMLRNQLTQDEYRMHVIFSVLDSNKNGYISIDELVHCMPECEVELIQLIQLRFNEADQDKDGQLSFDEFTELLTVNDKLRNSTMMALHREEELMKVVNDNEHFIRKLS